MLESYDDLLTTEDACEVLKVGKNALYALLRCQKLKGYGCEKYQLSLDGMRETHDWFRKPGSFDITLEKIEYIKKAGIRAVIMTTVSGTNIEDIA